MTFTGDKKREYQREWMKDRRAKAIAYLGGCCVECGTEEELEFDHIDRNNKEHNISSLLSSEWGTLLLELVKCQLLCKDCHSKKTLEELSGELTHGSYHLGYRKGCLCEVCKAANAYRSRLKRFRKYVTREEEINDDRD